MEYKDICLSLCPQLSRLQWCSFPLGVGDFSLDANVSLAEVPAIRNSSIELSAIDANGFNHYRAPEDSSIIALVVFMRRKKTPRCLCFFQLFLCALVVK
jgi:hypothetical protein